MKVHIHRAGESYGPYSVERVRVLLKEGRITPGDLAWHAGASGWRPLSTIPEITAEPVPAAPQPVPARDVQPSSPSGYASVSLAMGYVASFCLLFYYLLGWLPQGTEAYFPGWWPMVSTAAMVGGALSAAVCLAAGVCGARRRGARKRG